jgi:hypothetical protein
MSRRVISNGHKQTELRNFLRERRESVKLFLLFDEVVSEHRQLRRLLQSIDDPHFVEEYAKSSSQRRLGDIRFAKMFLKQSRYARSYPVERVKQLSALVEQMIRMC